MDRRQRPRCIRDSVTVDGDGSEELFGWLTCNEIMIETERYMSRRDDPRGMVVGGKSGMCTGQFWVAGRSMFQTVSQIPSFIDIRERVEEARKI